MDIIRILRWDGSDRSEVIIKIWPKSVTIKASLYNFDSCKYQVGGENSRQPRSSQTGVLYHNAAKRSKGKFT